MKPFDLDESLEFIRTYLEDESGLANTPDISDDDIIRVLDKAGEYLEQNGLLDIEMDDDREAPTSEEMAAILHTRLKKNSPGEEIIKAILDGEDLYELYLLED